MYLSDTTKKLQIVLTTAKTTTDMSVVVAYTDTSDATLPIAGTTTSNTNGITAVDIVSAPTDLFQRKVREITVKNIDTVTKTVVLYLNNNGTQYPIVGIDLAVGETFGYCDTKGFYCLTTDGAIKSNPGLTYANIVAGLGFVPENVANKSTDGTFAANSDTLYPSQKAAKDYVDSIAGGASLSFFLSDSASDIGTYYTLLNNPSGDPEVSFPIVITANPTLIKTFATLSTEPRITTLIAGVYSFHIHAAQTAGTKTSNIYANLYTRTSGGAETLRSTSNNSITLTGISADYDLHFTITSDIPVNITDRLVLEVLGVPIGAGTNPTITIYFEGTTASRLEFRTTSSTIDQRYFVKYGMPGGQIGYGGTDSGDDLLFGSTSDATKGYIGFGNLTTGVIYDEVNNYTGFGIVPLYFMHFLMPATSNYYIDGRTNPRQSTLGVLRMDHTADIDGTRPINLDVICAGHGDTHAINVDFHATGIAAGDDNHIYDVHIDTANSTGGEIAALAIGKSGTGTVVTRAIETYHGVEVLEQRSGTITAIEQAWTYTGVYTDVTANFSSAASDVQIFAALNDYVYIGMAGTFDDIEVNLAIAASGAGIKPVFQYSAGAGVWTTFTPVDGSNGFRTNGNISWSLPLAGWATDTVNAVTKYWVRIQRTQNTLATPPTEDIIKVFSSTYYSWDDNANLSIKSLLASGATAGIGYTTGAGGTITQLTSKATGVTLNKVAGNITMDGAALAAGAIVSFVLTNSAIAAEDYLAITHHATGTFGAYSFNTRCALGSATIDVTNISAGSLSEAIVLKYVLLKAVAT